jgi:hypothetical protein
MSEPENKAKKLGNKGPVKRRNRKEGQIARLAKTDPRAAEEMATYGRKRSEFEKLVDCYLATEDSLKRNFQSEKSKDSDDYRNTLRNLEQEAGWICELFLEAVERRDGEALRTIAKQLDMWGKFPEFEDPLRAQILCLKNILEEKGGTMTIPRLAALLSQKMGGDPAKAPQTEDGYSSLRRIAKSVNFPVAKTGRPQKVLK